MSSSSACVWWITLCAALWVPAARAMAAEPGLPSVDLAEEAELHFRLGVNAYSARDFTSALDHLMTSHRLAPNRNTAFNIGRCYSELQRPAQAWRYFHIAVEGETRPQLREPVIEAMSQLEPQIARVEVISEPAGATVYVERRDLGSRGTTPVTLALEPGEHTLILDLQGHTPEEIRRTFEQDALSQVTTKLSRVEADRRAAALERTWVKSTIRIGEEVILDVEPQRCEIFPRRLSGVSAWREPLQRLPGPTPGSELAARWPAEFSLDVVVEDLRTRHMSRLPLSRDDSGIWLDEAGLVRAWALQRCEVLDGAAVADVLEALPKKTRLDAIAILSELASSGDVATAVRACHRRDCAALGQLLAY